MEKMETLQSCARVGTFEYWIKVSELQPNTEQITRFKGCLSHVFIHPTGGQATKTKIIWTTSSGCFREASCRYDSVVLMITRQQQTFFSGVSESDCVIGQTFGVGVANTDKWNCYLSRLWDGLWTGLSNR